MNSIPNVYPSWESLRLVLLMLAGTGAALVVTYVLRLSLEEHPEAVPASATSIEEAKVSFEAGQRLLRFDRPVRAEIGERIAVGVLPPGGLNLRPASSFAVNLPTRLGRRNQTAPERVRCYEVTAMLINRETNSGGRRCINTGAKRAIDISWQASPGATAYQVYRSTLDSSPALLGYTTGTNFTDNGGSSRGHRPPDRSRALFFATVAAITGELLTVEETAPFGAAQALAVPDDGPELAAEAAAAIAGRVPLMLTKSDYQLFSTVDFAPAPGLTNIKGLSVEGTGPGNTVLHWNGPSNQPVLRLSAAKNGEIKGFWITGGPASADLQFLGHGGSSNMRLDNLLFDNPAVFSVQVGAPSDTTEVSEFALTQVNSFNATGAGFQIEGNNSLNFNFYSSGCSHEPVCVSNDPKRDPVAGAQAGGNFNWFGGSISDTPLGVGAVPNAAFVLSNGVPYNFTGLRIEDSATLLYTPPTDAPIQINWVGGLFINEQPINRGAPIIIYQAGGSFQSTKSSWGANGNFQFGPLTKAAVFEDDLMAVASGRSDANPALQDYFAGNMSLAPLRLFNTSSFVVQ